MKITLESTSQVVLIAGVPARIWEGHTESGIAVHCAITRIAIHDAADASQFEAELIETKPPSAAAQECFPMRMFIEDSEYPD